MLKELVLKNRSYRGYDRSRAVTREELVSLVELARNTPSAINLQPLKYRLVVEKDEVAALQAHTRWAAGLPELRLPFPGTEPVAFIVVCVDTAIAKNPNACLRDVGIVSQTMLLGAVEMGLGGCMLGNFDREDTVKLLGLKENLMPDLVIAIGKPAENIRLTEAAPGGSVKYYRDADGTHCVPKRGIDEVLV